MSNDKLANEARQIIDGIRRHQVNSENKLTNVQKQVADLKVAIQKMTEAQEKPVVIEGKNDGLKQYVRDEGLQLFTQQRSVNIHGYGTVRIKEEVLTWPYWLNYSTMENKSCQMINWRMRPDK